MILSTWDGVLLDPLGDQKQNPNTIGQWFKFFLSWHKSGMKYDLYTVI